MFMWRNAQQSNIVQIVLLIFVKLILKNILKITKQKIQIKLSLTFRSSRLLKKKKKHSKETKKKARFEPKKKRIEASSSSGEDHPVQLEPIRINDLDPFDELVESFQNREESSLKKCHRLFCPGVTIVILILLIIFLKSLQYSNNSKSSYPLPSIPPLPPFPSEHVTSNGVPVWSWRNHEER